jgi:hypothetical protein
LHDVGPAEVREQAEVASHYRAIAENGTPPAADGAVESFTTPATHVPVIEGESATEPAQTTATLTAQVNPEYQATEYSFQYATSESALIEGNGTTVTGAVLPPGSIAAGFTDRAAAGTATGLQPNTLYYFRVLAKNATGQALQSPTVATFTTSGTPLAVTEDAGEVTATTARVTGTVTPEALPATYYFQYGGTSSYGRQTATAESGAPATPSIELAGLQPFTTVATPPILTGLNASAITETSATITAALEPQALSTRWELALGATPGSLQPQASGDVTANTPLSIPVSALTPGTAYHYRLTATNLNGTVEPEGVFTTAPAAAAGTEPALPALIPFTPVSQIAAKEDAENKANSKPPVLTNKQKRQKALTVCRRDKRKSKRQACEQRARKRYPLAKKKG